MALTVGAYVVPGARRGRSRSAAVLALTALNYVGVQKSRGATRVLVAAMLGVLAVVVVAGLADGGHRRPARSPTVGAVRRAAGGRAAVLRLRRVRPDRHAGGGGARPGPDDPAGDPARARHHPGRLRCWSRWRRWSRSARTALAAAAAPLRAVVAAGGWPGRPVVRVGAALAALGVAARAAARRLPDHAGDGPRPAPAAGAGRGAPALPGAAPGRGRGRPAGRRAGADRRPARRDRLLLVRACCVYYAIANASALTLPGAAGRELLPVVGLAGCLLLAVNLPWTSVVAGAAVLAAGIAIRAVRLRRTR